MTLQTNSQVRGCGLAAGLRRGGEAFASTHIVPRPAENCKPPGHLTPGEAELWLEAEQATDDQRFCDCRRARRR